MSKQYRTLGNTIRDMIENKDYSKPIVPVVDSETKTVEVPKKEEPEEISCKDKIAARLKSLKIQHKTKIIDNA